MWLVCHVLFKIWTKCDLTDSHNFWVLKSFIGTSPNDLFWMQAWSNHQITKKQFCKKSLSAWNYPLGLGYDCPEMLSPPLPPQINKGTILVNYFHSLPEILWQSKNVNAFSEYTLCIAGSRDRIKWSSQVLQVTIHTCSVYRRPSKYALIWQMLQGNLAIIWSQPSRFIDSFLEKLLLTLDYISDLYS